VAQKVGALALRLRKGRMKEFLHLRPTIHTLFLRFKLALEPRLRQSPVTNHRISMDPEHAGGFLDAQTPEIPKFHDSGLSWIPIGQAGQCVVQSDQSGRLCRRENQPLLKRQWALKTSSLLARYATGVVHQDLAHDAGGSGKKMRPVLQVDAGLIHQPEVGFVDQSRGLERVIRPLPSHVPAGDPVQLVFDDREQRVQTISVTAAPSDEQASDARGLQILHYSSP
jgi:hypothetical protein